MKTNTLLLVSALALLLATACEPGTTNTNTCDCEKLRLPASEVEITGAEAEKLRGEEAGLPLSALPGVKTIRTEELYQLKEAPETGLYLVDTDFVPQELEAELKEMGFRLSEDGTLDSAGVKTTLFVQAEVFRLKPQKQEEQQEVDQEGQSRAFPLPWAAYSYNFWWRYNGGFCRDYHAHTRAYAYGPRAGGIWPVTNIQLIQTHVNSDTDVCFGCYREGSDWSWDIGCFWPAHGGASGYHYIYMYDPGITIFRTWGWSH